MQLEIKMAFPKNKSKNRTKASNKTKTSPGPVSISLRLPGDLSSTGRRCAKTMGISLNALVCVALTDYLQGKGYRIHKS
jgi:predicted HicB family RNase H-like nuclease